jgi:UDP-N-acetylmuramoyl-tripeptide--D-alanyl-D-alanine ligase
MYELGDSAPALHAECGARLAELGFDLLVTVGAEADPIAEGARARGLPGRSSISVESPEEAGKWLKKELCEGDVALLKASRGVHLERAWEQLEALRSAEGRRETGTPHGREV